MGLGFLFWRINIKNKSQTWKKPKDTQNKGWKRRRKRIASMVLYKRENKQTTHFKTKEKPKKTGLTCSSKWADPGSNPTTDDVRECGPVPRSPARVARDPPPSPPLWSSVQFAARSSAGLLSASVAARRTRVSCEEDPSFVAAIQRRRLPHTWAWQIRCFFFEVQLHGNIYALFLWPPSDRYPTKHYYYNICTYIYLAAGEGRRQAAN